MKIEVPDELSCLHCDKQRVCKFFTPLRSAVMAVLSEVGNWKDRDNTLNAIYGIVGANCKEHSQSVEMICKTCIVSELNKNDGKK